MAYKLEFMAAESRRVWSFKSTTILNELRVKIKGILFPMP